MSSIWMRRRAKTGTIAAAWCVAVAVCVSVTVVEVRESVRAGEDTVASLNAVPLFCSARVPTPKRQFRAMWIASALNMDWPSKPGLGEAEIRAEYTAWMRFAKERGFNAVIVQVRDSGGVLWPSRHEPWSQYLTGVAGRDPGWDPMGFIVAETHRFGLEFHAWFNPYRASSAAPAGAGTDMEKLAADHPLRQHPDWAVSYPSGRGGRLYYDPGNPQARRFIEDVIHEAVDRYDIDAVHFDDYFYPYPAADEDFPDDASYQYYGAGETDRDAWRRGNVDALVREVSERVHARKPWVKVGVSPLAIWRNRSADARGSATSGGESYALVHADSRKWVTEGWLDYVVPQLYWSIGFSVADYTTLASWWSRLVAGTGVQLYIGQAAYKPGSSDLWKDPDELSAHLDINRSHSAIVGDAFFRAENVREDRLGAVSRAIQKHYLGPALVPVAQGRQRGGPPAPSNIRIRRDPVSGAAAIEWDIARTPVDTAESLRLHAVYRVDGTQARSCQLAGAADLIGVTPDSTFVDATARPGTRYTYVVTSVDRMWRESGVGASGEA